MARSPHAYVRGSTIKFYEWLADAKATIPDGPPAWICGDCHLGNLGPVADSEGNVDIQIRDLDQTVIGNPSHDLVRLGLSLASAARGSSLPGVVTARVLERLVAGYEQALAGKFGGEAERRARPEEISDLLNHSVRRRWRHLAAERLDTVKPVVPIGRKFWALTNRERSALSKLINEEPVRHLVTALNHRSDDLEISLADAAYWMKGCSSLGRLRYAAILQIGHGKDRSLCLLDMKEATAAAAPSVDRHSMPRDHAARVVAGANALSPNLGERMLPSQLLQKPIVVRELMPQDLKLEIGTLPQVDAGNVAAYLGGVVGLAHGRQLDRATRAVWRRQLKAARSKTLDAPGWLWSSVVELLGVHEAAYLEHCRAYALAEGRSKA